MNPIGSRCCSSREQSVEQVVAPILDYFFCQSWDVAAVSRWVHASKLVKRFFIGCLAADLLPHALRDLKAHWDLSDSMESILARIIAADSNDFATKSKLRVAQDLSSAVSEVGSCRHGDHDRVFWPS